MSFFSKAISFSENFPAYLEKLKEIEAHATEVIAEIQAAKATIEPLVEAAKPLIDAAKTKVAK